MFRNIPFWVYIIAAGVGLLVLGWYFIAPHAETAAALSYLLPGGEGVGK